jgi:hypothetical protein
MGYFSGQKSKFVGRVEVTKPDRNPQLLGFMLQPNLRKKSGKSDQERGTIPERLKFSGIF